MKQRQANVPPFAKLVSVLCVNSPEFPEVWAEICGYLKDIPVLVAHNAAFDIGCIRHSLELYGMEKPDIT